MTWISLFEFFKDKVELIVLILGFLAGLYKYGMMFIRFIIKQYKNIVRVHDQIDSIFKEITPNGGGSIKDVVNSVKKELKKNNEMTEKIFLRQRWLLDNREDPIFESDLEGKCIWVNKPYLKITKRDTGFFIDHGWKNAIHEDDRERVISLWEECIKDGRDYYDSYRILDGDGNVIYVDCDAVRDVAGYIGSLKVSKTEGNGK